MSNLADIHAMPCILCELLGMTQTSKTDAHHPRTGQGGSQRAPDSLAIPLCHDECHQGPHGIHGDRSLLKRAKVDEIDLVGIIVERRLGLTARVPRGTSPKRQPRTPSTYVRPEKMLERRGFCS